MESPALEPSWSTGRDGTAPWACVLLTVFDWIVVDRRSTFCHYTDNFIQETDVPHIMVFSIRSHVVCKLGETDD